jgi:putative addiction module killer protein
MRIDTAPEFEEWIKEQTEKSKAQIDARLKNIEVYNYFGDHKSLGDNLLELRWKNGRRVYYALILKDELTLILLGGFKNAQQKDIKKARKILERETYGKKV